MLDTFLAAFNESSCRNQDSTCRVRSKLKKTRVDTSQPGRLPFLALSRGQSLQMGLVRVSLPVRVDVLMTTFC